MKLKDIFETHMTLAQAEANMKKLQDDLDSLPRTPTTQKEADAYDDILYKIKDLEKHIKQLGETK